MRVRKPPLSARSVSGKVVSTSLLYGTRPTHTLTYTPPASGLAILNPTTGKYEKPAPTSQPVTFEVFLEKSSRRDGTERLGLEEGQVSILGRIVKTPPGTPLEFPSGVKAGDTFDVTLFGQPGKLKLLPTPDEQVPEERRIRGAEFEAVFSAKS